MMHGRATKLERDRSRWVIHYAPAANGAAKETANEAASTQRVTADNVLLALGSPAPNIPKPFRVAMKHDQSAQISHIHEAPLHPREIPAGSRVAVVGGGIAAAHYLVTAAEHPIAVEFWNRDRLTVSQFDSDPCFVGPRCSHQFNSISTPRLRKRAIARARRPGSVPPDLYERLVRRVVHGRIRVHRAAVTRVVRAGNRILLEGPATVSSANDLPARTQRNSWPAHHSIAREYDYVVLATGFRPEVPGEELLAPIADLVYQCDGQPFPGSDLAIAPGLFVTGALAELRVGPPARNIIGAHLAGRRIVPALRLRVRK
jgi:pyruvate/2-oxoglutarate dehydrogenase complex dihydrolipoamide dehydrogenase (E3) component